MKNKKIGNYKSKKIITSHINKEIKNIKNDIKEMKSSFMEERKSYCQIYNSETNSFVFKSLKTINENDYISKNKLIPKEKPIEKSWHIFYDNALDIKFIGIDNEIHTVNLMNILFIGIGYNKLFDYVTDSDIERIHIPTIPHNGIPKQQFLVLNTFDNCTYLINESFHSFMKRLRTIEENYKQYFPVEMNDGDEKICWLQTSNGYEFFGKVKLEQEENWEDFMFIKKYNPKIKKFENLERRRVKCFGKKYCTPDHHCWNVPNNYPNMFLTNTLINIEYKERI